MKHEHSTITRNMVWIISSDSLNPIITILIDKSQHWILLNMFNDYTFLNN